MKRWTGYRQLPAIALLIVLTLSLAVTVVRAESGTITINGAAPVATSIAIDNYAKTAANLTQIIVDKQYTIVLNVTDPDLLTDERKIEVQLYTTNQLYNGTTDIEHHYSFVWTPDGHFANVGPSGPGSYFDADHSSNTTLTNTWGLFNFVFKLDKLAIYTHDGSLHWTAKAYIWDKSDNYAWRSMPFDVNLYQGLTIDSSVTWTELHAGSSLNAASNPNPGTWTYTSNAKAKIRINATTPTNAFGNTFDVSNLHVALNSGCSQNATTFTLATADWLTVNDEAQTKSVYWFVDIPAGQPTGTYTFTYYATIAFDGYAT
jgi:hypothetical protein